MNQELTERIKEITLELTDILSVVNTPGEVNVSEKVYDIFQNMKYFEENKSNLKYIPVKNDKLGRKSVMAVIRGKKNSSQKTVILIGHTDSVGISDYGSLAEYANKPFELMMKMKELELPIQIKKDLDSGDYLFGRGIFDMKAGVAILIAIMEHLSENVEKLEGNVIFAAVCDEEGNSAGMLNVVPELVKIMEKEELDYQGIIDTDYMTSEYDGDENKYIYAGTIGKLMPSFFIVGKETHVGEAFKGIDPNHIASGLTDLVNLNVEFCDKAEGEVSLPPVTLRQRDLKTEYSCQTAKKAFLMFNYSTFTSTPDEVINKMVKAADEAFDHTIIQLNRQYKIFCDLFGRNYEKLPWTSRVLTYEQLYDEVKKEVNNLSEKINDFTKDLMKNEQMDNVERTMLIVDYVHSLWSDRNPVIIVYFTPPYYPHIYVEGKTCKEKILLNAVVDAVNSTETSYKVVSKKFFPYISDLSYGAAPKDEGIIKTLKCNLPGFGVSYDIPIEDMQKLDLPVLNIGTFGKDGHKFTERLEKEYSFKVAPELIFKTIINLLD